MKRFLVFLLFLLSAAASAHEVRPALLAFTELSDEEYRLLWKVPARGDLRLSLYAVLPTECTPIGDEVVMRDDSFFATQNIVRCSGSLDGRAIGIEGLAATMTDALLRVDRLDGSGFTARLTGDRPSVQIPSKALPLDVARTYAGLGVEHILGGIDHLCFVLMLFMLIAGRRQLVLTLTAFTVGHSVTLALVSLGYVRPMQGMIELLIAVSIMLLAAEVVRRRNPVAGGDEGFVSLSRKAPWAMALLFGLLHGFGFAGALMEIGLPARAIPLALLTFNVGVEIGQLLFVVSLVAVASLLRRPARWLDPPHRANLFAYPVGAMSAVWTVQRLMAL